MKNEVYKKMDKTITLKELLIDSDDIYVTYTKKGRTPVMETFKEPEQVIEFIKDNIYDVDMLVVNEYVLDIDKIIEKYSK